MTSEPTGREEQLAYSELMDAMLDERKRRQKAQKILAVVRHALGRDDLAGLRALDVGCSAGFIADELALAGAHTTGVDIDEPGLVAARERFGERVAFSLARGEALPFDDGSMDVVVFNHIYEHVVDPESVVADIHRVLSPTGVLYLGIGHRHQVIEPHYKLPFLSWLPQAGADRYMRLTRRGEHYYEHYYSRAGLRRLFGAFDVWDYTLPVLADSKASKSRRALAEKRKASAAAARSALDAEVEQGKAALKDMEQREKKLVADYDKAFDSLTDGLERRAKK